MQKHATFIIILKNYVTFIIISKKIREKMELRKRWNNFLNSLFEQ